MKSSKIGKECMYCHDLDELPRYWHKGRIIGEDDVIYIIKCWSPFAPSNDGCYEHALDKQNVVIL